MRELELTNTSNVAYVDDEDYFRLSTSRWKMRKFQQGKYIYIMNTKDQSILLHRVILNLNKFDGNVISFADRNGFNCQKQNLRIIDRTLLNAYNRHRKDSVIQYKGVHYVTSKIRVQARITFHDEKYNLGSFLCLECAACAYNKAAREFFGSFAELNVIGQHECGKFGE